MSGSDDAMAGAVVIVGVGLCAAMAISAALAALAAIVTTLIWACATVACTGMVCGVTYKALEFRHVERLAARAQVAMNERQRMVVESHVQKAL